MLLLRSFPLSLSILWRFMLVLPLWVLLYIVLTAFTLYGAYQLVPALPVVGIVLLVAVSIFLMAFSYMISMHPYLIGIRIGLKALGIKTESSHKRLFSAAVIYGFIEGVVAFGLSAAFLAIAIVTIRSDLALADAVDVEQIADPMAALSKEISLGTLSVLSVVTSLAVMALRAALLPSLAGVAAGGSHRSFADRGLAGLGANFASMMALLLMITAISAAIIPFIGDAVRYVGLSEVLSNQLGGVILFAMNGGGATITMYHVVGVVIAIVVSVWLFCLQCAGAALSYEARVGSVVKERQVVAADRLEASNDIGDLLRSRMPGHSQ